MARKARVSRAARCRGLAHELQPNQQRDCDASGAAVLSIVRRCRRPQQAGSAWHKQRRIAYLRRWNGWRVQMCGGNHGGIDPQIGRLGHAACHRVMQQCKNAPSHAVQCTQPAHATHSRLRHSRPTGEHRTPYRCRKPHDSKTVRASFQARYCILQGLFIQMGPRSLPTRVQTRTSPLACMIASHAARVPSNGTLRAVPR
jgi:hypothetical protein